MAERWSSKALRMRRLLSEALGTNPDDMVVDYTGRRVDLSRTDADRLMVLLERVNGER